MAFAGEFNNERNWKVLFGRDCRLHLVGEVERVDASRILIVTTRSISRSGLLEELKSLLNGRVAAVFADAQQHGPLPCVRRGADVFREVAADSIVSLGGGSAVDVAKGIAMIASFGDLAKFRGRTYVDARRGGIEIDFAEERAELRVPPIFALPTTLSGAEFTYQTGLTDPETGKKEQYYAREVLPRVIVLDPQFTLRTPSDLWLSSGVKSLDHNVERLYSRNHHPFSDALALRSTEMLFANLPISQREPNNLDVRANLLFASWMAQFSTKNVNVGVGHAIDHQLCAYYDIPHGIAACIMLPHAMEFNREAARDRLCEMAEVIGLPSDADAAITATRDLIAGLGFPSRLRDVGVQRSDFAIIAERALHDTAITGNPRAVESAEQIVGILEGAW